MMAHMAQRGEQGKHSEQDDSTHLSLRGVLLAGRRGNLRRVVQANFERIGETPLETDGKASEGNQSIRLSGDDYQDTRVSDGHDFPDILIC